MSKYCDRSPLFEWTTVNKGGQLNQNEGNEIPGCLVYISIPKPAKHNQSKHTSHDAKFLRRTGKNWKFYCSATRITLCVFVRTMPWFMYSLTARSSPNHRHHRHRSLISKILELVVADIVAEWQKNSKEAHWDVNVSPETIAVDSVKNTSTQTIRSDKNYQYSPSYNNPCNNHD